MTSSCDFAARLHAWIATKILFNPEPGTLKPGT